MNRLPQWLLVIGVTLLLCACMTAKGDNNAEKRAFIDNMRQETLARLYREKPEAKERMGKMAGYAVFSSVNTNLLLLSSANGYGVAMSGGSRTYMKMYSLGVGVGAGIKDYRVVFMFKNAATYNKFVEKGWEFGGNADAAVQSTDKGGAVGGQASVDTDMVIYTLTEAGVALQATVAGTKYWKDKELN